MSGVCAFVDKLNMKLSWYNEVRYLNSAVLSYQDAETAEEAETGNPKLTL
jgi:hypothetical protein